MTTNMVKHDDARVGQPQLHEAPEADRLHRLVDEPVGLQDEQPDHRGDGLGQDVRREEDQRAAAPARAAAGSAAAPRPSAIGSCTTSDRTTSIALWRIAPRKRVVVQGAAVVVEPDVVGRAAEPVPVVEAVVQRLDDREQHEQR